MKRPKTTVTLSKNHVTDETWAGYCEALGLPEGTIEVEIEPRQAVIMKKFTRKIGVHTMLYLDMAPGETKEQAVERLQQIFAQSKDMAEAKLSLGSLWNIEQHEVVTGRQEVQE